MHILFAEDDPLMASGIMADVNAREFSEHLDAAGVS